VLTGAAAQGLIQHRAGSRRRQRLQVCTAARVLTALGGRVHVVPPPVRWPRTGGLLVAAHDAGWLGDLALLTSVPRTLAGWDRLADRALPFPGAGPATAGDADVLCPVTVTCRTAGGPLSRLPRRLQDVAALRDLVVEVRLLAPVAAPGQEGAAGTGTAGTGGGAGSTRGPGAASGVGVAKAA
jgi:hypothetical protein